MTGIASAAYCARQIDSLNIGSNETDRIVRISMTTRSSTSVKPDFAFCIIVFISFPFFPASPFRLMKTQDKSPPVSTTPVPSVYKLFFR